VQATAHSSGRNPGQRLIAVTLIGLISCGVASTAFAQMDLSGEWLQKMHQDSIERGAGPDIGDYTGMPINDADRMRGDSWTSSKWEQIEHECEPHPADYAPRGPGSMRVWADMDPATMTVTSWHTEIMWMQPTREIFMDERAHPPAFAPHTWQGYSTGHWNADMLEVDTDHLKEGWLRRNGLQRSEKAHMKEFVIRHEDYLTLVSIVHDPVFLTEPLIRSSEWVLDPGYRPIVSLCTPVGDVPHPKGWVAYELPGQNNALDEFAVKYGIPIEGVRGGAETLYPEYQERLLSLPVPTAAKPAHKAPASAAPKAPQ
jgi:hypothetical protein